MKEAIETTVDTRQAEYVSAIHTACDAASEAARQRATDHQAKERARLAAIASRPRVRSSCCTAWQSLPMVQRHLVPWGSMPLDLRLELANVPERIRLDVAGSALILMETHAGDPKWPARRIVKRACGLIIDERLGRYDAGTSRRGIGDNETALTERHARDLAGSVSSVLSVLVEQEDAARVDPRAVVTAALIRALPDGETILAGLLAGRRQCDIAKEVDVPTSTLCNRLARVHEDAAALLS